jgi:raffinose/stachyose/melibiose transport system permease protein
MFFNSDLGPINYLLRRIGLGVFALRWLGDKHVAIYSCIFAQTWQYVGLFVVIFLAGLKGIPVEIFESANIEGASSFQTFLRIAVPLIIEYLSICVILAVTGCLKAFDQAWIMTKGGPGFASSYLAILMYKKAFIAGEFGFASAITMTILVLSLAFTYIYKKYIARDTVDY